MKKFSELGITLPENRKIYNCEQVSITDILNNEIEILSFLRDVETKHGSGRYLIHFRNSETGVEGKFFTNSSLLKEVLNQVKEEDLPFSTIIKAQRCGNKKLFQFT